MSKPLGILFLLLFLLSLTPTLPLAAPTIKPTATRTIDGDPTDWTGTPPATDNTYTYSSGEWIWKDAVGDQRNDFAGIWIDGNSQDWYNSYSKYIVAIDNDIANDQAGANLTKLFVAWDDSYLYIALETDNTGSWNVAYGIGIDANGKVSGYNGTSDAWSRAISFGGYAIDYEIYFWWDGGQGKITTHNFCNWTGSDWGYYDISALGGSFAYTGDSSVGLQFIEMKIPWSAFKPIQIGTNISIIAWVAGGDGSSAVDSVPPDPTVTDNSDEWNDSDNFTSLVNVEFTVVNKDVDTWSDLVEWRITGDTSNLYMMFELENTTGIELGGNGAPYIAVVVDTDRTYGSGSLAFPDDADTNTSENACWEYAIIVNLADSRLSGRTYVNTSGAIDDNNGTILRVIDKDGNPQGVGSGEIAVNLDENFIEIAIPWSALGFATAPDNVYIRFSLLTGRGWSNYAGNSGGIWDIYGTSDALDVVTDAASTWDEVSDGDINYYVDVWFENGEPAVPPTALDFVDPSPPANTLFHVGDTVDFKVELTVAGSPVEDQSIWVYINDVNRTDLAGKTGSDGTYSFSLTIDSTLVGTLNVTVYHPGNTSVGSQEIRATRLYTVKYEARITNFALNATTISAGDGVEATGVLEYYDGSSWRPLGGEQVEIVLVNRSEVLGTGTTLANGSFTIEFTMNYVGDNWEIKAHYPATTNYDESYSDSVLLTVKGVIDLTTNANDFPAGSLVYKANDVLVTPTGEPTKDNMSMLYITWDSSYLYIGVDWAPEDWDLGLGIAIDVNPGNSSTGYGAVWAINDNIWEDCWKRHINMSTPFLTTDPIYPELLVYFWYNHTIGITAAQINRYKYESYPPIVDSGYNVQHWEVWQYDYATPEYSPVAESHNGTTLFKVAIPWSAIMNLPQIKYTGKIAIAVWSTHGEGTSAMSVLPMNPTIFDKLGWDELSDSDVLYEFVEITYDQDVDGTPDLGVQAVDRAVFYPSITTIVETDQDTYTVGAGGIVNIKARVKDEYGYYLPVVKMELYDHNSVKVAEALTGYNDTEFWATLSAQVPTTQGVYTWTVRFVGEAGFQVSTKTITVNVTGLATKILLSWTYTDNDANGRVSSGDTITLSIVAKYLDPNSLIWEPLGGKDLSLTFSYARTGLSDSDTVTTLADGTASYTYTVQSITGADILTITVAFSGDSTYAPSQNTTSIEINLARLIDGTNDWGTELPRSTPGIAPRGDEIVISDPTGDINSNAQGTMYSDLDIKEVRITYDGIYLYFYVKFAGGLTDVGNYFTVNVVIDATPDNPSDGIDEWVYGVWFTDAKLGGFDPNTGSHIDRWNWTHIIEARPYDGWVDVRALTKTTVQTGEVAVNTADGFIEFKVPLSALPGLDPAAGFRTWIMVFGLDKDNPSQYFNPPGTNVIDAAGVGNTNAELLTSRDPDWGNLVWPSEDIWVDQAFMISFSGPGTPSIPEPDPATTPTQVLIVYPQAGSTVNVSSLKQPLIAVVLVKGTQGRPVTVTIPGVGSFTGVVGADDVAIVPYTAPISNGTQTITATSDGASDTIVVTYQLLFALPLPEVPVMPIVLLAALLLFIILKKRK